MDMKKIIGNIIFIAIILLLISRFLTVLTGAAYPLSVVSSSSMKPSLNKGDIVPWIPCDVDDVKIGDVVVYRSVHGYLMIHRIVDERGGRFITRGDANNYTDQEGPHVPEPLIGEENLCGRAIMVGRQPLKIPLAGYFWLFIKDGISKLAMPMKWRHPQPSFHYLIFSPFIFSTFLFLLILSIWIPNGRNMKEKLHEMIFGVERLKARRAGAYIVALFIPFLLLTSFFSYDHAYVDKNEEKFSEGIPVFNPSILKVRGIIFAEGGNVYMERNIFSLGSGEGDVIKYGGDHGEIYLYSSPYWLLLPPGIMHSLYGISPKICVVASSVISALILSFLTLLLLILLSLLTEGILIAAAYLSFSSLSLTPLLKPLYSLFHPFKSKINIMGGMIKNMAMWIEVVNKRVFLTPLATFLFIPLLFDGVGNLLLTTFLAAISLSILSYLLGARFKNEMAMISISSSFIISLVFVSRMISLATLNVIALFEYASLSFLLAVFLFFIEFPSMLIVSSFVHRIRESIDPCALTEVCDL